MVRVVLLATVWVLINGRPVRQGRLMRPWNYCLSTHMRVQIGMLFINMILHFFLLVFPAKVEKVGVFFIDDSIQLHL